MKIGDLVVDIFNRPEKVIYKIDKLEYSDWSKNTVAHLKILDYPYPDLKYYIEDIRPATEEEIAKMIARKFS